MRLLLLMDVGGTMDPYFEPVSQLLTALHEEHGLRDFQPYYFHNCVYDHVYTKARMLRADAVATGDVLRRLDARWKLAVVGDAAMHPAELLEANGNIDPRRMAATPSVQWLHRIADALRPLRVDQSRAARLLGARTPHASSAGSSRCST